MYPPDSQINSAKLTPTMISTKLDKTLAAQKRGLTDKIRHLPSATSSKAKIGELVT